MLDRTTLMLKHFGTDDADKVFSMAMADSDRQDVPDEAMTKTKFPYYAPDDSLPPIPTAEDVENAHMAKYPVYHDDAYSENFYRVNTVYAVKFSENNILLQEAENLLFLQDHEVRAPKVYACFSHQGADPLGFLRRRNPKPRSSLPTYYYLVTEFLDGVNLNEEMWEDLTLEVRDKIYGKIGEQLKLLRSIPPPTPNYYGRINSQPYSPHSMIGSYRHRQCGPFFTYRDLLEQAYIACEAAFAFKLTVQKSIGPRAQFFAANFFPSLEGTPASGDSKLSHMDLLLHNMILVPSASNPSTQIEDYDLWLIDWEYMAWMPAWAEAAGTLERLPKSDSEQPLQPQWGVSDGIKPFYYAQACFYRDFTNVFGKRV